MAAFIPLAIQGGMALYGHFANKKRAKEAAQRSAEEQTALSGATGIAGNLAQTGSSLVNSGMDAQQPATNFYRTLLQGNRGAMNSAVAGPTAAISDVYSGAERNLDRTGVRGAGRDVAMADLSRQRAGQISSLITGVQPMAADKLAGMGSSQVGQGIGAQGTAGNIFGGLLGEGFRNRVYGNQEADKAGQSTGSLLADLISSGVSAYSGGGVGGTLKSKATTPNWTSWMPQGA